MSNPLPIHFGKKTSNIGGSKSAGAKGRKTGFERKKGGQRHRSVIDDVVNPKRTVPESKGRGVNER